MTMTLGPIHGNAPRFSVRRPGSPATRTHKFVWTAAAALLLATGPLLHAQILTANPKPPEVHQSAGVRYVSGGVGREALRQMQAIAGQFNVRLSFQDPSEDGLLSGVTVIVTNEKGERLLSLITEGPLLYLKLPRGRYYLTVIYRDADHEQWITAEATPMDLTFLFNMMELDQYWLYAATGKQAVPVLQGSGQPQAVGNRASPA